MSGARRYDVTVELRYTGGKPISVLVTNESMKVAAISLLVLADTEAEAVALAVDTVRILVPDQEAFRVDTAEALPLKRHREDTA